MIPNLSKIGVQMSSLTGIKAISKDIIETLQTKQKQDFINLSAGNPVLLPKVEQMWRDCTAELLASSEYGEVVCRYGSSQGYIPLIEAIAKDFNRRYGLSLNESNILITPGSQMLYFYAANAFGGYTSKGDLKQIVLPISPDYTGYGGICLVPEALISYKPTLDIDTKAHRFKYHPDFNNLVITENTGCILFSRPCNPTGNILSNDEIKKIAVLAKPYNIPVFIDSAYGPPFPAINFKDMTLVFGENIVHCMSFSKAGLPGERIGVAIGDSKIIQVLESFQANLCLHPSGYGQAIAARAINSGALEYISTEVIRPFYKNKILLIEAKLDQEMPKNLPWFLHCGEGAMFAWLWFNNLPISDLDLYQELKQVGVIVVAGRFFFPGLKEDWSHKYQCIRISLTASEQQIETAMKRLAEVIQQVYQRSSFKNPSLAIGSFS
ncbi:MAG: valine--pyruvate transaminase [Brasilonema octagenarum HA4186-MV1]|jgi:valine--pyruvate aminotransferase|uniref:Valine--pyruvate transaminase n=2 Tax=Brasilonema TaxID=383614 RepID=A0A856MHG0_9CYAN|nr:MULTISPECIES: valine--pyruvate transaminase [Brasilonema]MBW4629699.1 valine--pyruvate transaminase [Brasilonema octagenarum HA4186-MV1]NMF63760.1 valine--pyruvate transaminase [Brasilonema octagenarum UFV-OR1]QDL09670.1 valine--pyruvate transaminase [Brasilonema sennae CENA114]QDL16024.1 valine--pyruvate transaminase [Brasilonema octagenarum UFV-E1]